jgi:hypothetical protein
MGSEHREGKDFMNRFSLKNVMLNPQSEFSKETEPIRHV